ncbi:hypothetical protein [Neobacillus sp. PS2-9]|uniref:hypothetical protein n=1 Tax=Neobacillus sp. PS2-9 TaxID=3070676 RepID=UPI0027E1AB50|nr:hypothetical protein [Neobacillus sp. PS2-9]WML56555.1 hypothetical protein RCG25_16645 [Neobacillus sp. PS2-9]
MKDIFSYNGEIEKNAYMNWRTQRYNPTHNMNVIAKGFSDSALLLAKDILKDNRDKKADILIFPLLFNTNHSIEVYLKAICWQQNLLLNKNETFEPNHNLKGLFIKVIELENELNSGDQITFRERLSSLEMYIDELYGKIERTIEKKGNFKTIHDITFSRYSLTNDFEPQFYINTFDNVTVDLENYLAVFKGIFDNLDALSTHYYALLEGKQESEYESRE